ncbi:SRPBCC domain-containing protein [Streptomyces sp. Je 1-79]|uniref:SRPBCC domain-containing protein n=1 Tax=Streptomyces sp. Je 1-79 TaxID=2943847 RepID=UPI0021A3E9E8|nr:SRPBCC domain-containing protein [Streptomyces sp. Je 1-79]MCT4354698.1 SRPBCC domain-containing protein [Streptomyces sp. Je 1-79]
MEHEVFVPVPAEVLYKTLTDPVRVARCVPGLQQDADAEAGPLSGRLKIRAGGNTITYRGALRMAERGGVLAVEGKGSEVRGKGSVKLSLAIALTPLADGTTLTFTGTVKSAGRLAELSPEARESAAQRLIEKFVASVAAAAEPDAENGRAVNGRAMNGRAAKETAAVDGSGPETEDGPDDRVGSRIDGGTESPVDDGTGSRIEDEADSDSDGVDDGVEEPHRPSVFETPVPPPSLDPFQGSDFEDAPVEYPAEPPAAEAAHARRTMIGRSAEEVDHAPPRGRYAPVPAPESTSAGATLRWIAPAAALALASAVVVGRALRRRR